MINTTTIARATVVIAALSLLSKGLGFLREMALAYVFGASSVTDAFLVAYTLPNIIFAIIGGALVIIAVPVFSFYAVGEKKDEAWHVFNIFITVLGLTLILLVIVSMPFSRQIIWLVAPGLPEETALLAKDLLFIMLPIVLFYSLANLFTGLLNANNIFGPSYIGPLINNCFLIASIIVGAKLGICAVAVGALVGNIVAVILQIPYLRRAGFVYQPILKINHPGLKQAYSLMLPVMIGTGVGQIYLLIDRILASGLVEGSISALNYASKLILLPQGIITMAVGTAIFTSMSTSAAQGNLEAMARTLIRGIKMVFLIIFPAGVGLALLRDPIIRLLFMRGAFDESDTVMTAFALLCFSFGLVGQCLNPLLNRGFFALRDTVTPVKIGIITVGVNLFFSVLLIGPFKHGGLALANSIAANFNIVALFWVLCKHITGLREAGIWRFVISILFASLVMGGVITGTNLILADIMNGGFTALALRIILDILIGIIVLASVYSALKVEEYMYLRYLLLGCCYNMVVSIMKLLSRVR